MISSLWPLEVLIFSLWWIYLSVEIQFLWNGPIILMMAHMATVRTTLSMKNSSLLISLMAQVPYTMS